MKFGVFSRFWESGPNHLPFSSLNTHIDDDGNHQKELLVDRQTKFDSLLNQIPPERRFSLSSSVELLERVLRETEIDNIRAGFSLLLEDADWRAHTVAAVVASMMYRSKGISWSDQLWKRLHEGSWASPQLCVVLSYIDRTFLARAREVIGSGGRIDYSQELGPMLSHSKRGPAGQEVEERKVVQALCYLADGTISSENTGNNGGLIAQKWQGNFQSFIESWTL